MWKKVFEHLMMAVLAGGLAWIGLISFVPDASVELMAVVVGVAFLLGLVMGGLIVEILGVLM